MSFQSNKIGIDTILMNGTTLYEQEGNYDKQEEWVSHLSKLQNLSRIHFNETLSTSQKKKKKFNWLALMYVL